MKSALCLLLLLAALGLPACGKKPRNLDPPPGSPPVQYPKRYPPADSPDEHL
jgi:hypothetical protein